MRRHRIVAIALGAALSSGLPAWAAGPDWAFNASVLAAAPIGPGDGRSTRLALEPALKWRLPELDLRARVRLRSVELQGNRATDTDLRELTASWRSGDFAFKLGAQQLNWGRMDILRITDLINPVDLSDLFYEELPESKLALPMLNLEWQNGARTVQLIVAPAVPVDRLPARWNGLPVQISKPASSPENATLALRYGFEALGWSADLLAVKGWQASPTLQPVIDTRGPSLQATLWRQNSIGFSADKPVGATVLRVEGLYARLKPYNGLKPESRRQASLGVGIDVRAGAWFIAGQVIARQQRDTTTDSDSKAYLSVIVQRKWLQDRLAARALHIREPRTGSSWTSLRVSYELSANHLLQLQADRFSGETPDDFGAFAPRSRIAVSLGFRF